MSGGGGIAGLRRIGRRADPWLRRARRSHQFALVAILLLTLLLFSFALAWPTWFPASALVVPLLLGGLLLGFRSLLAMTLLTVMLGSYVISERATGPRLGFVVVLGLIAWIILAGAKMRRRLGVQGTRGESMLIELRDLLTAQGELPRLPRGWRAEVAIRSAGSSSFSGDFVVASTRAGEILEIALVDVSGKGLDAGTRALLLSGAFGGLLGVVPVAEFLPSANQYLRRQDWDEDFATVVHVAIDLGSGEFQVRSAGHPPALQFDAWSGRWQTQEASGPLLGLVEMPEFHANTGLLKQGDALLLYSDGMVETRNRDINLGTDRLAGHAERLVAQGFKGAAEDLVVNIGGPADDAAIVVIHRKMHPSDIPTPEPYPALRPNPLRRRRTAPLSRSRLVRVR